jgi:N-acetylglutamate synthase-like GNAT family acetyltransferase
MENRPPDSIFISTERSLLDLDVIHGFLSQSYWAKNIPRELVRRSMEHSLCFGVYELQSSARPKQVGFARIISDYATFAYLCDVFILPDYRGRALSKALVEEIVAHPDLQGLRRWMLVTLDAHGLYEQFGFHAAAHPERHMEIHHPGIYEAGDAPV